MIVVIGLPAYADEDGEICAGGLAVEIAAEASRRGGAVELAGKIGGDGAGDAVVVALGRLGIGHAALLRDPAKATPLLVAAEPSAESLIPADTEAAVAPISAAAMEPEAELAAGSRLLPEDPAARPSLDAADVEMALRYLTGPSVVVVAEPLSAAALAAAVEGAAFAGARLVVLAGTADRGRPIPNLPDGATVLEMPPDDDASFARLLGSYAASLDAGVDPARAFRDGIAAAGWEPSAE
jgi:hypothetical protein